MHARTATADDPPVRLVGRLVMDHAIGTATVWARAFEGDILGAMAWLTIDMSNLANVFADRRALGAYLARDLTDADRRPLAVRALGASMGLDAETMRRCVRRLVDRGFCEMRPDGAVVPFAAYDRPEIAAASVRSMAILSSLCRSLDRLDVQPSPDPESILRTRPWESGPGAEARARQLFVLLNLEYVFRVYFEDLAIFGHHIVTANVFQFLLTANNRPFVEDEALGWTYAWLDTPPPDELRRPISVRALAAQTGHPVETTRRHVKRLTELGLAEARDGGLVVPTAAMARPELLSMIWNINVWFMAMVRKMDRLAGDLEIPTT